MPRISGTSCQLWLNGTAYSGDVASFELRLSQPSLRANNLARKAQVRLPGIGDFEATVRIWGVPQTPVNHPVNLPHRDDITSLIVVFGPDPEALAFAGNCLVTAANWRRGDDGSLAGECTLMGSGEDAGWFTMVFAPLLRTTPRPPSDFNYSIQVPERSLPSGTDLAIWCSANLDEEFSSKAQLSISNTRTRGASNINVRDREPLGALPSFNRIKVLRNFGNWRLTDRSDTGFRLAWVSTNLELGQRSALENTDFIIMQGVAWGKS